MRILHLTEKDYKVGLWSGGSTTELFIWPEGVDYGKREFTLRVSSARVDLEESDFTPLMGVTRYITPLTGGFTLTHPGTAPVVMGPLAEPYRFSGEIATHCVGKATDFNLMLKGVEGEMTLCHQIWQIQPGFNSLYAVADTTVDLGEGYALKAGELLVVFAEEACTAQVSTRAIVCFAEV
jgi:environmental stress-induced protein Ves